MKGEPETSRKDSTAGMESKMTGRVNKNASGMQAVSERPDKIVLHAIW